MLKNLFNRAIQWDLYAGPNPVVGVRIKREPQQRLRFLDHDEEQRLLDHCSEPLRSLLVVCINTGLRLESEALTLKWHDVDLKRRLISVSAALAKSGRIRDIPLNTRAIEAFHSLKTTAKGDYVFRKPNGQPFSGPLRKPFAKALRLSGLAVTGISPHVCRHTFCSRLVMAGTDLRTVQELGGWSDLSLVQRYAHLAPGRKAAAVESIVVPFHGAKPKAKKQGLHRIA